MSYLQGYRMYKDEFKSYSDFKLFLEDKIHFDGCPRSCDKCLEPMIDGYTCEGGDFHVCSDSCLYKMMSADWKIPLTKVKKMHDEIVAYEDYYNHDVDEVDEETYEMFGEVYYTEWYDSGHFWEL